MVLRYVVELNARENGLYLLFSDLFFSLPGRRSEISANL
jgi:hypothetical protein